ncbi:MAG TPA: hypothetical protein EYP57_00060 [Thermodesulfobacteriaceae bacterium]|nr:hypothetical protein [Thermodesulfobacteriaceae bacterium]
MVGFGYNSKASGKKEPCSSRAAVRRIVLDVLKPHEPSILAFAQKLSSLNDVDGVDITVYEMDAKVENIKITIQGKRLIFEKIVEQIENLGGAIHSIDKVSTGRVIVEEAPTPQD